MLKSPIAIAKQLAPQRRPRSAGENVGDRLFRLTSQSFALFIVALVGLLLWSMLDEAQLAIRHFGPGFLVGTTWDPVKQVFGVLPAAYGTVVTAALALIISVPVGLGAAIFLAELAPGRLGAALSALIELLAALPSVVVGLWGLFLLVPVIRPVEAWLGQTLGFLPVFSGAPIGVGLLGAGVVLSIMVLPILTAVIRDVLRAVPDTQREAMLALGATQWETIAGAVLPYGRSGIVGAVMLALGRALGETMAVTMVIGNTYQIVPSLFSPATTLASLISTQFREADTPLYLSALVEAGVVLFSITVLVNILARLLVWRMTSRAVGVGVTGG